VTTAEESPATVDYRARDTQSVPGPGIKAVAGLAAESYPAIVGALSSGVTLQTTQQVGIPNDIVSCTPASTTPTLSILNDRGYVYRTAPSDAVQARLIARLAWENHDASSAATVHLNNDYGRQLSGAITTSFDGEMTAQVPFDGEKGNYGEALERALADDPDLLVVISYVADGVALFEEYFDRFDGEETVFVTDGLRDPTLPEKIGESMENVYGTAPLSDGPGIEWFETTFQNEYDSTPGIFTAESFDAAAVLLLANAAAGENHGPSIRDSIDQVTAQAGERIEPEQLPKGIELAADGRRVNYGGASGSIRFDGNGDISGLSYEYFSFAGADGITRLQTLDGGQA
jgi:ABC-type branched-subunit amino acid transport system substrate-binding protein